MGAPQARGRYPFATHQRIRRPLSPHSPALPKKTQRTRLRAVANRLCATDHFFSPRVTNRRRRQEKIPAGVFLSPFIPIMRILHTADWHLADRLGRIDRTEDLRRAVERIAELCTATEADVLVIAGDLFSDRARPEALQETMRHLNESFRPFLTAGGAIVAITGNHDNE